MKSAVILSHGGETDDADLQGCQPRRDRQLGAAPGTEIRGIGYRCQTCRGIDRALFRRCRLDRPWDPAPVPAEYAAAHDRKTPSTYGRNQVATGPYMIENDSSGRSVDYRPGREIRLVRNPSWNRESDHRPAYLDEILVRAGNADKELGFEVKLRRADPAAAFTLFCGVPRSTSATSPKRETATSPSSTCRSSTRPWTARDC